MTQPKSRLPVTFGFWGLSLISMTGGCQQADHHHHQSYHPATPQSFVVEDSARPGIEAARKGLTVDGQPILGTRVARPYNDDPVRDAQSAPPNVPASESIFDRGTGLEQDTSAVGESTTPAVGSEANGTTPNRTVRPEATGAVTAPQVVRPIPESTPAIPDRPAAPPRPALFSDPVSPQRPSALDNDEGLLFEPAATSKRLPSKRSRPKTPPRSKPFQLSDEDEANEPLDVEFYDPTRDGRSTDAVNDTIEPDRFEEVRRALQ